jgi:hypothetical protein
LTFQIWAHTRKHQVGAHRGIVEIGSGNVNNELRGCEATVAGKATCLSSLQTL